MADPVAALAPITERIAALLEKMTLAEKIGQMSQVDGGGDQPVTALAEAIRASQVGSVINQVDVHRVNELQRVAVEESRLGIPLLIGRDVIHGFRTIMPIPLGQAASWNPALVRDCARAAAIEAARAGINWTFAPMIDISRDPRWGRIAESLGEDPVLTAVLGSAMIEGFQGENLAHADSIAACAKHFAGYGAVEGGRDYAATNVPENELRNVYLRPFKAAVGAGVATLMASFSEIDGVPASANEFLMRRILRDEWAFEGFVVSDWDSIRQLAVHGLTEGPRDSALESVRAGLDMEMAGDAYSGHLAELVESGHIDESLLDAAVARILRVKFALGLFEHPYTSTERLPKRDLARTLSLAKTAALQSAVLLQNNAGCLPLCADRLTSVAVIGPLADAPAEQLGTWIFDGEPQLSITPLSAIRDFVGEHVTVRYVQAMHTSRSRTTHGIDAAVDAAAAADAVILFLGEEAILSGEAHCRADIGLPGNQAELVRRVRLAGKPTIAVILAGRPLTLTDIVDEVDAILFAWHPGTMAGPAITELLFGIATPSGKLPASFPRMVGQIPIHYNHKSTGKPPTPEGFVHIDDIDAHAPQTSLGMQAFHLDAGYAPLFAFGHGLSYTQFSYANLQIEAAEITPDGALAIHVDVVNTGSVAADEIVQVYTRDLVGNVTRPVKELKAFRRVRIAAGETSRVSFRLPADELAFYGRDNTLIIEPGEFLLWVGGGSEDGLCTRFRIVAGD